MNRVRCRRFSLLSGGSGALAFLGFLALTACSHVAPYQRGKLAHPMMTNDLVGPAAAHVMAVHEGATGGGQLAESGCGCN